MQELTVAVVGAAHPNKDGGNRRSEIMFCDRGEPVFLEPEPKNPHDEHAIAVRSARDFQIGYVSSERAVTLKGLLRTGHELHALFQAATPYGALIRVGIDRTPTLPAEPESSGDGPDMDGNDGFWPDPVYDD